MTESTPRPAAGESRDTGTADPAEIARFAAMADRWWDPDGPFKPLHQLNPLRLRFVRDRLAGRLERDPLQPKPLAGLDIVDVGCGGGLLCEPLARLGATVTGVDASERTVAVAQSHAAQSGLDIAYRQARVEELAEAGASFDAVVALEVLEHVASVDLFLAACCRLTRPGGVLVLATINRTAKAFVFAIVGAEYVLRWLPRGTHRWDRFVRPSELAAGLRAGGARIDELAGVSYDVMADDWRLDDDVSVNYMALAIKQS